ncbi:hypothetical protein LLG88_13725 [bacterium]|nr:hypothetical protein [bacterium]
MNKLLTLEIVTLEALRVLTNNLVFTGLVNRQYDSMFGQEGAKVGSIVYARVPPKYIVREGDAIQLQATTEDRVPIKLTRKFGIDISFSETDRLLSLNNYSDNILRPILAKIGNKIDLEGLKQYKNIYNAVGTLGTVPSGSTTPTANMTYLKAGVKLANMAAPQDALRSMVVTPDMQAEHVGSNFALLNPANLISESFRNGQYAGAVLGWSGWHMDQNCATHTEGTRTGTNGTTWQISGAQTGASLLCKGFTSGDTINQGDVFTIGTLAAGTGVQSVNPESLEATGYLQDFVCTAPCTAAADGTVTIPISPSIITSGAYQTVNKAAPADAVLTFNSASAKIGRVGLGFHRDAFTFVTAKLKLPKGVHEAAYAGDDQTGVGVRMVTAYDIRSDEMITRFDVLCDWTTLRAELASRVHS